MINKIYEKTLLRFNSVLYRLILIIYSIIILTKYNNLYGIYIYAFYLIFYTVSIAYLLKVNKHPNVRLLIDLLLISLVLYGKDINNVALISYLYLPIINSPNHTGNKKSFYLIHLSTLILFIILLNKNFNLIILLPITCYTVLGFFENIINRISKFNDELYHTIDRSYSKNVKINKTHKIYRDIIKSIENTKFYKFFPLINIFCIKIIGENIFVINASKYVYDIKIEEENIKKIINSNDQFLYNIKISIDNADVKSNLLVKIDYDKNEYIFICELSEIKEIYHIFGSFLIVNQLAKLVFQKIARIIEIENEIKMDDKNHKDVLKQNIAYISRSRLAMHFLRNKFSPIKTHLQLAEKIRSTDDSEMKEKLQILLIKSESSAKLSMETILKHTDLLLEQYTTFSFHEVCNIKLYKLFTITKTIWEEQIEDGSITHEWSKDSYDETVCINETGYYFVALDIIENIRKYGTETKELIFQQNEEKLSIIFRNSFPSKNLKHINKIVTEFSSDDATEIAMRRTHGLSMIKQMLNQMNIKCKISVESFFVNFEIYFKRKVK